MKILIIYIFNNYYKKEIYNYIELYLSFKVRVGYTSKVLAHNYLITELSGWHGQIYIILKIQ